MPSSKSLSPPITGCTAGSYASVMLVVLVAVAFAYWRAIGSEFVVDDKVWAALPAAHWPVDKLATIFTSWGFEATALQVKGPPQYRPLGTLLQLLSHWSFGPNPVAFHLFSLACHYGNCLLVFVLLGMLVPALSLTPRLLCTLAFALHPALIEAVVWITAVNELQMTTCVLLAMISYLQWKKTGRQGFLLAAAAAALAGVMIKEGALAFVLLVLVADWCLERKVYWRAVAVISAGTLLYFGWRLLVIGSVAGGMRLNYSVAKVAAFLAAHLRFLFLPGQQPFSIAPPEGPIAGVVALALTDLLLLLFFWWGWRQTVAVKGLLAFGGAWILITLWPAYAIGLVGGGFFAGRHIYLPAVGWTLLLAVTVLAATRKRPALQYLFAVGVLLLGVLTTQGLASWRHDVTVYQRSTALSPNDQGALEGLADALFAAGTTERAMAVYGELLERVANPKARRGYLYRLALMTGEKGLVERSNHYLQEILRESPDYAPAWVGLGNNAWLAGEKTAALQHYQRALTLEPGNLEATRNRAELQRVAGGDQGGR